MNDKNIEEKARTNEEHEKLIREYLGVKDSEINEYEHIDDNKYYVTLLIDADEQNTLTQYKEALRKLVELTDMIKITDTTNDSFEFTCKLSKAITKAEQLLYRSSKNINNEKDCCNYNDQI